MKDQVVELKKLIASLDLGKQKMAILFKKFQLLNILIWLMRTT